MPASSPIPGRLTRCRDLIDKLSLTVKLNDEVCAVLEDVYQVLYATEQDMKVLRAANRSQAEKIVSLEKRYSEILYKLAEIKSK